MTTYLVLNCLFFVLLAGLYIYSGGRVHAKAILVTLLVVLGLTAVFDPIMIAAELVAYDTDKLLGLYWFGAPLEDFAYTIFAVPFVALVWTMLEKRRG